MANREANTEIRVQQGAVPAAPPMAWYAVGILTVAYTFSYIDRQILSLMVGPIRADLGISDSAFSLLHGLAFAVFYTLLGVPIGRLADRRNRRNIIALGVAFWSLATVCCGLARSFWQLFAARVAVGVGEAALSPAAYSMLADLFPKEKLGRAIGIYSSGVFVGIGLSFIIGGMLIATIEAMGGITLPVVGHGQVGVSCHAKAEVEAAANLGADYALLSPVKATTSHPEAEPLGWQRFKDVCAESSIPVYALGGMSFDDQDQAFRHGGQGIAILSAAWL